MKYSSHCSFYKAGRFSKADEVKDRFEIYNLIKSGAFKAETDAILERHFDDILDGFKNGKTLYQEDKRQRLSSVCFAGAIDRTAGKDIPEDFCHSGIMTLDIDGNKKENQVKFFEQVKQTQENEIGFAGRIEAVGRSVSGKITGDLFATVRIEIPSNGEGLPEGLIDILTKGYQLPDAYNYGQLLDALHKAYHKAFSVIFERGGLKIGKQADLKRMRYLSDDADLYINENARRYTLEDLTGFLRQHKETQDFERLTFNINETDAFLFAEQFAKAKGYQFTDGQRHYYRNSIAIALNLLGVAQREAECFILEKYRPSSGRLSNEVSLPYAKYKESFGIWSHKLTEKNVKAEKCLTLAPDQYLNAKADEVTDFILKYKKVDLKAGTGVGKSYTAATDLPKRLKAANGYKTIIVTSLNAKAEKDQTQYGVKVITGERLAKEGMNRSNYKQEVLQGDVILTSQNYFPKLAKLFNAKGERLNVIIDESHSLVSGQAYRSDVIMKLYEAIEATAETVTLLSGTPSPYFSKAGFKRLEVIKQRPEVRLHVRYRQQGDLAKTALTILQDNDKKHVIKIESKEQIELVKAKLLQTGWNDEEILTFYSDTQIKETEAFQKFLKAKQDEESFRDCVKVVLTTCVIGEGLDVYSENEIVFSDIERLSNFDVKAKIQFFDRHRTHNSKDVFLYVPKPTQPKEVRSEFNGLATYEKLLKTYTRQAGTLNEEKAIHEEEGLRFALLNLKTAYSATDRIVYFDTVSDLFKVNTLALAGACEEQEVRNTDTDTALKTIATDFPYFTIIDERDETEETEGAAPDPDLSDLKAEQKEQRQSVEHTLIQLYRKDKETLLQAIGSRTLDIDLKKAINYKAKRKDEVEALVKANSHIFKGKHLRHAERLAKAAIQAKKYFIEGEDFERSFFTMNKKETKEIFAPVKEWTNFVTALKLHILIFFYNCKQDNKKKRQIFKSLTATQYKDAERLAGIISTLEGKTGQRFDSAKLASIINKHQKGQQGYTQRKAVILAGVFFDLKRITGRNENVYQIGKKVSLPEFLKMQKIDVTKYATTLHNLLNDFNLESKNKPKPASLTT